MTMLHRLARPTYALVAATVLISAGCGGDSPLAPNQGRVRFVLGAAESPLMAPAGHDALPDSTQAHGPDSVIVPPGPPDYRPVPVFRSAELTFSSILARNLDGVLVDVAMDLPVTVDVSELEGGRNVELPEGELPEGTYDEVVFVLRKVEVVLWNETRVTIEPPGGGWTANVPLCPRVEVEDGDTTTVSLKLQVWSAFFWYGDRLHFEPGPLFHWPGSCWNDVPPPIPLAQ
jgi:hypothetical protein